MGIKFYCPECEQKLNVKAFLAGKRGFCPKCGASIDIPKQSTRGSSAAKPAAGAAKPDEEPVMDASLPPAAGAPGSAQSKSTGKGRTGAAEVPRPMSQDIPQPTAAAPTGSAPSPSPKSASSAAAKPVVPADVPLPTPATAQAASTPPPEIAEHPQAAPASPAADSAKPGGPQFAQAVGGPTSPAAPITAAPAAGVADPLAEAPQAAWYVRHPSGGQFGPAPVDVMRRWLAEGRVSGDSLVWREGWPEWRRADGVFPQLASPAAAMPVFAGAPTAAAAAHVPVATAAAAVDGGIPSFSSGSSSSGSRITTRRKSDTGRMIAMTFLTLLVLLLVPLLVYVLANQ